MSLAFFLSFAVLMFAGAMRQRREAVVAKVTISCSHEYYIQLRGLAIQALCDLPANAVAFRDDGKSYTAKETIAEIERDTPLGRRFVMQYITELLA